MSEIYSGEVNIEKELRESGYYASTTKGVSMEPLFRTHRDMIILKAAEGELKKYDVALYKYKDKYVLHRVVGVREDCYLIRGDNTYVLERVPKDAILAVLVEFVRAGKKHSCRDFRYRVYSVLWTKSYHLRVFFRFLKRAVGWPFRRLRRLFRRKNEKNK